MAPEFEQIPGDPPLNLRRWSREGEPLLLLHGLGANTYWWEKSAPLMTGFQTAALDFRGHGGSGWVQDGVYGLAGFLDDIERARKHLGWEKFSLVAHSMGARVSLSYARLHPDRLKKFVAIDFLPEFGSDMVRKYNLAFRIEQPIYPTLEAILHRFRLEPPETALDRAALNVFARDCAKPVEGGFTWKFDWRLFHVRYESAWPELTQIKVPALIVFGEKSGIMTRDDAAKVAANIPQARVVGIDGAFHHIPLDAPAELAKAVGEFLL